MRPSTRSVCVIIFAFAFLSLFSSLNRVSAQTTVTLNAANTGWYSQNGYHNANNPNYLAGRTTPTSNGLSEFHNFFVFDLSNVQGTITNAVLKVRDNEYGYFGNYPTQTLTIFEVLTPIGQLTAPAGDQDPPLNPQPLLRPDIYTDLGAGVSYGSLVVEKHTFPNPYTPVFTTSLNVDGVGALNRLRGPIAFGGAVTSLHQGEIEYLFGGSGESPDDVQLELTIVQGDPTPTLTVNDVNIVEGNTGESNAVFNFYRTGLLTGTTIVNYATADGTATEGNDYQGASGTLTFLPGETSKSVSIKVFGDTMTEPNETFFVNLSTPTNGIVTRQGTGTILNDDTPVVSISDATIVEGNDPNQPNVAQFTISINVPTTQDVYVYYNTADGTATAPSDYTATTNGFPILAGQTSFIASIPIRGDSVIEQNETFTVSISTNPMFATIGRGTATGTIVNDDEAAYAGQILITEFRPRGANGALDEFVELYNNTDAPITVTTTDNSSGWALAAANLSSPVFVIPNGTVFPARAHILIVNSLGYSLNAYPAGEGNTATGDFTYTTDIPDNTGIAFFRSATSLEDSSRLDAVGFGQVGAVNSEGIPLRSIGNTNGQYSFVRKSSISTTLPQDTDNNLNDFTHVATDAGQYGDYNATLGAPGPENLHSPIARNTRNIRTQYIDPMRCSTCSPNRILETEIIGGAPTSVLKIRRTIVNNTGGAITRLRFRVIDITTLGNAVAGAPQADLRVISSTDETIPLLIGINRTAIQLTREEPPDQTATALDGGINTTLNANTITLAQPLAGGDSVSVNFWLRRVTGGAFRFYVNIETLP